MNDFEDWFKQNSLAQPETQHQSGIAPLAKRIAEENHLDWTNIKGTGTNGLIIEKDVLMALAKKH